MPDHVGIPPPGRHWVGLAALLVVPAAGLFLWPRGPEFVRVTPGTGLLGQVVDADGPIPHAHVRFRGRPAIVTAGADGRFQLSRPSPSAGRRPRVTAWKDGYLIAGTDAFTRPLRLALQRLPAEDCERYAWVDPTPNRAHAHSCGNCHGEIYREWAAGGHARSATGPHFRSFYDGSDWHGRPEVGWGLLREHPLGSGVCASCHAPTAATDADTLGDLRRATGVAALGVHCDFCHKIVGPAEGEVGLAHGRDGLQLKRPDPSGGQLFFGPLDDVDRGEDAYSPFYRDSRYCASCHEGNVFGVDVYTTYSEWLESPARRAGRQCQDCHMAPTGRLTNLAPGHGGIPREPLTLGNHRFFAGTQADMLRRCLRLEVAPTHGPAGVRLAVAVRAEAVGHRVPTGFVDRHLILTVEAWDAAGRSLPAQMGPRLPPVVGKPLAGQLGRLYAKVLRDAEGRSPVPFWRAEPDADDTRLRPGAVDRSTFAFASEARRVRVRLLHRRTWQEVAEMKQWPDNETMVEERMVEIGTKDEKATR